MGNNNPGVRPGEVRTREAVKTLGEDNSARTHLLVVTCPKDFIMFSDAVKTSHNEKQIEVRDLAQLLAEALELEVLQDEQIISVPV